MMTDDFNLIIDKLYDISHNEMECRVCKFREYCGDKAVNSLLTFCDMIYDIKTINDEWEEK